MYSIAACICMCVGLYKNPLLYSTAEAGNAPEEVTCFSDSSTSEAHSLRSFQSDSCDDNGEKHALQDPKSLTYPPKTFSAQRIFKKFNYGKVQQMVFKVDFVLTITVTIHKHFPIPYSPTKIIRPRLQFFNKPQSN